jgi:hypothetical protein
MITTPHIRREKLLFEIVRIKVEAFIEFRLKEKPSALT